MTIAKAHLAQLDQTSTSKESIPSIFGRFFNDGTESLHQVYIGGVSCDE